MFIERKYVVVKPNSGRAGRCGSDQSKFIAQFFQSVAAGRTISDNKTAFALWMSFSAARCFGSRASRMQERSRQFWQAYQGIITVTGSVPERPGRFV